MPIVSGPISNNNDVKGSEYNALRQDVVTNHNHDGSAGSRIEFSNLADGGQQISVPYSRLAALDQAIPWAKCIFGIHNHAAPVGGWTGESYIVDVTFPNGQTFANNLYTLMVSLHVPGGDRLKQMAYGIIHSKSNNGFRMYLYNGLISQNGNAETWPGSIVSPPVNVYIQYLAIT